MENALRRAQVLAEALPYIREFSGKTVVVKYGGQAMADEKLKRSVARDITLMKYVGIKPVIVHGGGKAITTFMEKLGIKPRFIEGNRVTDSETMEIAEMVLMGKINKQIVSLLNQFGGRAVGIGGKDGELILASRSKDKKLGLVGEIEKINSAIIEILEREGFISVVAPIGMSKEGETLNINADIVAAGLAGALKAEKLIFLTDVEGILEESALSGSLISTLSLKQVWGMIKEGRIQGGMLTKMRACESALKKGVSKVHIISGLKEHSLLLEIFTDRGIGTQILP